VGHGSRATVLYVDFNVFLPDTAYTIDFRLPESWASPAFDFIYAWKN